MPLKKGTDITEWRKKRLHSYYARKTARRAFGEDAIRGRTIHHMNGNETDNRPSNLLPLTRDEHGKFHGAGVGTRGKMDSPYL